MRAINPAHFTLSVYTSQRIGDERFQEMVLAKLAELEQALNVDGRLRWHVSDNADAGSKANE